jgi:predicted PurR-regulated permease PerM
MLSALVIGGTLLGIAGAFLAVPAAAVIQVLIVRIVDSEQSVRTQLTSHGELPAVADGDSFGGAYSSGGMYR